MNAFVSTMWRANFPWAQHEKHSMECMTNYTDYLQCLATLTVWVMKKL